MFNERLEKYRHELHFNKTKMANKLEVSDSYYTLIELGKRRPSKNFMKKLVSISKIPEECWLYGIVKEDYLDANHDFKNLRKILDTTLEFIDIKSPNEIFDDNNTPIDSLGKLIIAALKADVESMSEKSSNLV